MINRNFLKLWWANAISTLGDGAMMAAGPLLVASQTKAPLLVAGAVAAQQLPWLLFSLPTGAFADRFNRRKVLIFANVLRALAIGGLAVSISFNSFSLPIIYLALFLLGTGDALADNGTVALVPGLVPKDKLEVANSRLQGANVIGRQLAGPPLGAFLFTLAIAIPFYFDAATFIIAALLILRLANVGGGHIQIKEKSFRHTLNKDIRQGLKWLWENPLLRTLALLNGGINVASMLIFASFVLYAQQRLGLGSLEYGLLLGSSAIGGLIGSVLVTKLQKRFSVAILLRSVLVIEALVTVGFVLTHSPIIAGVLNALLGALAVIWMVIVISLRQRAAPSHLLGRVNGVYNLFKWGGLTTGSLLSGVIGQIFGITTLFWLSGTIVLLLALLTWNRFISPEPAV